MDYLCTIITTYQPANLRDKACQTTQHVTCPSRFEAQRMVDVLNASHCDVEAFVSVRVYRPQGALILSADDINHLLDAWTDDRNARSMGKPKFDRPSRTNGASHHGDDIVLIDE